MRFCDPTNGATILRLRHAGAHGHRPLLGRDRLTGDTGLWAAFDPTATIDRLKSARSVQLRVGALEPVTR
jgi:hypothetical protein